MQTVQINDKLFQKYITSDEIQLRVTEIADELLRKFEDKKPVFIVVLRGAFMFAADLLKLYNSPCEIEFVKLSSYTGMASEGKINIDLHLNETKIKGRDIIVLEDIVDSGLTMFFFKKYIDEHQPASVTVVTFLSKPNSLENDITLDIVGFTIPSLFVVGYGLDYDGQGRNFNSVYQLVP